MYIVDQKLTSTEEVHVSSDYLSDTIIGLCSLYQQIRISRVENEDIFNLVIYNVEVK